EFLLGKILAFVAVALAECLLGLLLLFTYFELGLAGDPTPFIVATVLYAFCVASFGTMIGAAIPSQAAAMQAVALGGFLLVFPAFCSPWRSSPRACAGSLSSSGEGIRSRSCATRCCRAGAGPPYGTRS